MILASAVKWYPLVLLLAFPFSNTNPPFSDGVTFIEDVEFSDNRALLAGGEDMTETPALIIIIKMKKRKCLEKQIEKLDAEKATQWYNDEVEIFQYE